MDSASLAAALAHGEIAGAVLDVWEGEPAIDQDLLAAAAIATPHIAGYSLDGKAAATEQVVRAVSRFFSLPPAGFAVKELPLPSDPLIRLDDAATSEQELFYQAFCHSYDIRRDDALLRRNPGGFEQHREGYAPRREPPAYHLVGGPPSGGWLNRLGALGFCV